MLWVEIEIVGLGIQPTNTIQPNGQWLIWHMLGEDLLDPGTRNSAPYFSNRMFNMEDRNSMVSLKNEHCFSVTVVSDQKNA